MAINKYFLCKLKYLDVKFFVFFRYFYPENFFGESMAIRKVKCQGQWLRRRSYAAEKGSFFAGTYSDKRDFVNSGGFAVCRSVAKKYRFFGNKAVFGQQCGQQNVFGWRRAIYMMNQRQQVAGGGEFSDFGSRRAGNDENGNFCTGQFAQRFYGTGDKRSIQELLPAEGRVAAAEIFQFGSRDFAVKKWRM